VETSQQLLSSEHLIKMFVDIVSKNGNLLINVGPKADGTIPENQLKPLKDLGKWMKKNSEGIYDTQPWTRSSQVLDDKTELRFTRKKGVLYVYFLSSPKIRSVSIPECRLATGAKATLVGENNEDIKLVKKTGSVQIELPKNLSYTNPFMVKISGLEE
jgi:alpha-L-fucosidase